MEGLLWAVIGGSWADVKQDLQEWSKAKFGNTERNIASLTKRLERLQNKESPGNLASIKLVQSDLNNLLEMEAAG
jgi:hypothetical protein